MWIVSKEHLLGEGGGSVGEVEVNFLSKATNLHTKSTNLGLRNFSKLNKNIKHRPMINIDGYKKDN